MTSNGNKSLISTFTLGEILLAVDAMAVQEIIRVPGRTNVYLSPAEVWGVINLRGKIVTVWDLRVILGLETRDPTEDSRIVVLKFEEEAVGFLVDGNNDVIEIETSGIRPVPANVEGFQARYLKGIFGNSDRIISLMNLQTLEQQIKG